MAVLPQEKDGPKLRGCSGCSIIIQNNNQKKIVFNIYIPEIVPYINNLPPDVRKLNDVTLINAPDFSYPLDFLDKDNIILHSIGGFPGSYPSTINLNLRTGEFIQKFDK